MNRIAQQPASQGAAPVSREASRVLRQVYVLLAISLIPTVLGAMLGLHLNITSLMVQHQTLGFFVFLGVAMGMISLIHMTKNSGWGVAFLLLFTFFMGVILSQLLGIVLGLSNGMQLIELAFGGTAVTFAGMAVLATAIKRDLGWLSKFAFVGLLMLITADFANIFLHLTSLLITTSVAGMGLFALFMLIDVKRVLNGGETNYIVATLSIYLDLYNFFVRLLTILSIFSGRD